MHSAGSTTTPASDHHANSWTKIIRDFVLGGTSGAIAKTLAAPI